MPNITYSLGGTGFDAVPEKMDESLSLPVRTEATLGRGKVHVVGVGRETIVLTGKYMSVSVKNAIEAMYESCGDTGATVVFDDDYSQRDVLIGMFETKPLVGVTEGFSFRIELIAVS